jgi:very-short-patch-repair endonuclease
MVFNVMQGQTSKRILIPRLQRSLRNNATDAERTLWQQLRNKQVGGCKFRRQHPCGNYILDFVCLERRVVVEVDGSQHFEAAGYDNARTLFLRSARFGVLRFWNNQVFRELDGVLEIIRRELANRTTPSPPNPPLEGEG